MSSPSGANAGSFVGSPGSDGGAWPKRGRLSGERSRSVTPFDENRETFEMSTWIGEGSGMVELWQEGSLCDVTLRSCDGRKASLTRPLASWAYFCRKHPRGVACSWQIPCHKVVLAAASGFFRALFTGAGLQFREHGAEIVDLGGVDGDSLEALLGAVYGRSIEITADNAEVLLAASNHLEVLPVHDACSRFLLRRLSPDTCLEMLALSVAYSCSKLEREALVIAGSKFRDVMSAEGEGGGAFAALPLEAVLALLGSDSLQVDSEVEVFQAGVGWVYGGPFERKKNLAALLKRVRLSLLPPPVLAQVAADPLVAGDPAAAAMVAEVARRQRRQLERGGGAPTTLQLAAPAEGARISDKFLNRVASSNSDQAACSPSDLPAPAEGAWADEDLEAMLRPRVGVATCLVAAAGYGEGWRSLKSVEVYDPLRDTWSAGPSMNMAFSFVGSAALGGLLYVVGGSTHNGHVERYDPRQQTWRQIAPPNTPRVHAGIAAAGGCLYIAGGRTGSNVESCCVERFDPFGEDEWVEVASLGTARSSVGAAELGGWLYAVGGQSGRTTFATCERMDLQTGQWHAVGPRLAVERKYTACAAAGGRLYAVGGMNEQRERLSSVEAYDPREGQWSTVAPMSLPRSSAGLTSLNGRLYVAGGNAGDDAIHNSVESFDPIAGRWSPGPPLACSRSGLALAAV